ncbi:unnamed protein product, partial [Protopolystoma xenopodis]
MVIVGGADRGTLRHSNDLGKNLPSVLPCIMRLEANTVLLQGGLFGVFVSFTLLAIVVVLLLDVCLEPKRRRLHVEPALDGSPKTTATCSLGNWCYCDSTRPGSASLYSPGSCDSSSCRHDDNLRSARLTNRQLLSVSSSPSPLPHHHPTGLGLKLVTLPGRQVTPYCAASRGLFASTTQLNNTFLHAS